MSEPRSDPRPLPYAMPTTPDPVGPDGLTQWAVLAKVIAFWTAAAVVFAIAYIALLWLAGGR